MAYNDILRLRIYATFQTAQVVNVMHFVSQDATGIDTPQDLANDFATNMLATLRGRANSGVNYQYVEVQKIVPFAGGPATATFGSPSTGTVGSVCVSATLCEVLSIYSERGGRRGRGRIYLPPASSTTTEAGAGVWLTTQTTRTQAFATALGNRYITATPTPRWYLGVWSRASGPLFPPWTTSQFARATGLVVRNTIRTQRRRQLGVGR